MAEEMKKEMTKAASNEKITGKDKPKGSTAEKNSSSKKIEKTGVDWKMQQPRFEYLVFVFLAGDQNKPARNTNILIFQRTIDHSPENLLQYIRIY